MHRRINLTAQMLRTYKSCPRLYELKYIEMLKPAAEPEYLKTGGAYHRYVGALLRGEAVNGEGLAGVMAKAFEECLPWREWEIRETEYEFDVRLTSFCHISGWIEAVCADGTPVEHRTTGSPIDQKYMRNLAWDDEAGFYLLALSLRYNRPVTRVIYTVCQKPTIRRRAKETEDEYLVRAAEWYTEGRAAAFDVVRSERELEDTEAEVRSIASEIRKRKHFYRNPRHCSIIDCSYRAVCLDYIPELDTDFIRKDASADAV